MKSPYFVQRCELLDGRLEYDYMGSTEFEVGDQPQSLKRIFEKGLVWGTVTVTLDNKSVVVHMIAAEGFSFEEYQPYLQKMVERELRLKERTEFDDAVRKQLNLATDSFGAGPTNVWFDFENDVLWTLSKNKRKSLVAVLRGIQQKWSET
ncbi:hypothetical protein HQ571_03330 [Candidatus Kuenenbacteria bacterium]|nr:hypothetical protein [Candidatus Kuenenbacteria bacterium]